MKVFGDTSEKPWFYFSQGKLKMKNLNIRASVFTDTDWHLTYLMIFKCFYFVKKCSF